MSNSYRFYETAGLTKVRQAVYCSMLLDDRLGYGMLAAIDCRKLKKIDRELRRRKRNPRYIEGQHE